MKISIEKEIKIGMRLVILHINIDAKHVFYSDLGECN